MNWPRPIVNASRCAAVVVLLAALDPLALSAQDPLGDFPRSLGDRMSLGLTAGVSIPQGEFSDVAGVGFELVAHVLMVNEARWLGLRVIGPTRMAYERVIPIVDITAKLLGRALKSNS
jgi:hypothetical protein